MATSELTNPENEELSIEQILTADYELWDRYVDEDAEAIFEAAMQSASQQFQIEAAEQLHEHSYYELAYEIAKGNGFKSLQRITEDFIKDCPQDALVYGAEIKNDYLTQRAIEALTQNEIDSEGIVEAYATLSRKRLYDARTRLLDSIHDVLELDHFGELHQLAIEHDDKYLKGIMANALKEEDPEEALLLAQECNDPEVAEEIMEYINESVPHLGEYSRLLDTAQSIISIVEQEFGISLPNKVKVGGPKGSYATIRYKRFGEDNGTHPDNHAGA